MRSFIVLLLLVVVFLTGMLIGLERKEGMRSNNITSEIHVVEQVDQLTQSELHEDQSMIEKQPFEVGEQEQTTQKVAAFLEAGVKGVYEVIVEVLFQVSSLFI